MNTKPTLNRIIDLLPIYTLLLIISGFINTSIYYRFFGVEITKYFDWPEIFTLFLQYIGSFILLLVLVMAVVSAVRLNKRKNHPKVKRFIGFWSIVVILAAIRGYILVVPVPLNLRLLTDPSYFDAEYFIMTLIFIAAFLFIYFSFSIIYEEYIGKNVLDEAIYYIFVVFFILNIFSVSLTCYSVYNLKHYNTWRNTSVGLKNKSHIPPFNNQTFFIGKTNNWIFIYDIQENTSKAYRMEDVEYIKTWILD